MVKEYINNSTAPNSEKYHTLITGYRKELTDVWGWYDAELKKLEKYKDSKEYKKQVTGLDVQKSEKIDTLKHEYGHELNKVISKMYDAIGKRKTEPPTPEEINILEALKMRSSITSDDIIDSSRNIYSMLGRKVLSDIAKEHNIIVSGLEFYRDLTPRELTQLVDNMAESTRRVIAMDKPNQRAIVGDANKSYAEKQKALYSFRVDKDTTNTMETLNLHSGIDASSKEYQSFLNVID